MKKINWYYKFLIIFLICFSMFFLLTKNMSKIINTSAYKNYINFISVPFNFINEYNIFNYKNIKEENEFLRKNNIIILNERREKQNLEKEVEQLKKLLKLKDLYTDYDKVYAKVINRNKMYWYSTITIDKGSKDKIKEKSIVVTKDGLIGTVKSVTKDYSTIKLITNSDNENKISVAIKNEKELIHGTIIEYEYPYIKVELVTNNKIAKKGDELITSGLGNLPKNIPIGKIEKIKEDKYAVTNILYIKPYQDMNNINYLAVLIK